MKYICSQCSEPFGHYKEPCRHEAAELATPIWRRQLQAEGLISDEGYPPVYHCPCCGADQDPETGEWFWPQGFLGEPEWPREGHIWEDGQWVPYPECLIWRRSLREYLEYHVRRGFRAFARFSGRGLRNKATELVIQPPHSFGAMEGDDAYLWGIIHSYYWADDGPAPAVQGEVLVPYIERRLRELGLPSLYEK